MSSSYPHKGRSGTASSSPTEITASPTYLTSSPTIINTMLWMKKEAYEESTINETAKAIKGHYKASWLAFKSLEKKGIIKKVTSKKYRGREYPCFWATELGILIALLEGANPTTLLKKAREIFPENETLLYCIEIIPKLNPKVLEIGYSAVRTKGKLEPIDLATILLTQMQTETSVQPFWEIVEISKKYPKQYNSFKKQIEQMFKNLSRLKESI